MQEMIKKLTALKGILLLSSSGAVYILVGFDTVEDALVKVKTTLFTSKMDKVSYISQITLDKGRKIAFTYETQLRALNLVNDLIDDRNRYLRMLAGLSEHNYTIRKKDDGKPIKQVRQT